MRKRTFLAVSMSDLATRNRIILPPCRIRSTALRTAKGCGQCGRARPVRARRWPSRRRLLEVPGGGGLHPPVVLRGQRQQPAPPEWDRAPGSQSQGARCRSRACPAPEASEPLGGDQGGMRASEGRKGRRRHCASLARLQTGWCQGPLLGFEAAARLSPQGRRGGAGTLGS